MSSINCILFSFAIVLASCSGIEKSEYESVRKKNSHKEQIYRKSTTYLYPITIPQQKDRESYSWEEKSDKKVRAR